MDDNEKQILMKWINCHDYKYSESGAKRALSKARYFLRIAAEVASEAKCSRRKFGAVIVKDGKIISTGYCGSAAGTLNCGVEIPCIKDIKNLPHNAAYDDCPSVHAEENAVINADPEKRKGATLYLSPYKGYEGDLPCVRCRRRMLNGGLYDCWYYDKSGSLKYVLVEEFIEMENQWMRERGK